MRRLSDRRMFRERHGLFTRSYLDRLLYSRAARPATEYDVIVFSTTPDRYRRSMLEARGWQ